MKQIGLLPAIGIFALLITFMNDHRRLGVAEERLDALERNQEENEFTGATGYAIDTTNGVEYHYWLKGKSGTNSLIPYN